MTDNYQLILPMIITCLGATIVAQLLGGKPLYSALLARTLQRQEAAMAMSVDKVTDDENTSTREPM
jgi:CIC family chloride channel protein